MKPRISIEPSILSADFARLGQQAKEAEDAGVEGIQIDVMDGHFVPNLTFGPGVVKALRKSVSLFLDTHLMVDNPQSFLEEFARSGANRIIVHEEVCKDLPGVLQSIKKRSSRGSPVDKEARGRSGGCDKPQDARHNGGERSRRCGLCPGDDSPPGIRGTALHGRPASQDSASKERDRSATFQSLDCRRRRSRFENGTLGCGIGGHSPSGRVQHLQPISISLPKCPRAKKQHSSNSCSDRLRLK